MRRGALPEGAEKVRAVRAMFDAIAPRYDLLNRLLTFGLDVVWRRRTVRSLALLPGARVLDVACGTGDLCRELARTGHDTIGVDLSWGMLAHSRTTAALLQGDALTLPLPDESLDGATCAFALRNVADLPALFSELARVVRPAGRIALLEVDTPSQPILRLGHRAYFGHVVPRVGALLSDREAYTYLPRSVAYLPPWLSMASQLRDAGFREVARRPLSFGIAQLITATRRGGKPS